MVKKSPPFDPDRLVLTKTQIIDFCDRVLKKWNKNPTENATNIMAMNAVKAGILWTDEDSLKSIWGEIMHWMFELFYENALAQSNSAEWSEVMKKLKSKK